MPYTQVNAFASSELARDLTVSLNINNLFDKVGLTEAEQGSVPANGIITARTINGRTASVGLRYQFYAAAALHFKATAVAFFYTCEISARYRNLCSASTPESSLLIACT